MKRRYPQPEVTPMPSSPAHDNTPQRLYSAEEIGVREVNRITSMEHVVGALKSGLSIRQASKTLGLDKSKVFRLKRHAEAAGLLTGAP
jgi:hypothetical protein